MPNVPHPEWQRTAEDGLKQIALWLRQRELDVLHAEQQVPDPTVPWQLTAKDKLWLRTMGIRPE